MVTLNNLNDELIDTAQLFGETEKIIKTALQSYLHIQCHHQLEKTRLQIENYERKYQCTYTKFNENIQMDEEFLRRIQQQNPLWEEDAMEWSYWVEEYQIWQRHLQIISQI